MTLVHHVLSVKGAADGVSSQDSLGLILGSGGDAGPVATPRGGKALGTHRSGGGVEEEERDWERLVARAGAALDGLAEAGERRERDLQDAQLQLRLVRQPVGRGRGRGRLWSVSD